MCIRDRTWPPDTIPEQAALVPPPPAMVTVKFAEFVYPVPPLVIWTATIPVAKVTIPATALALAPPPPENVTVGAEV